MLSKRRKPRAPKRARGNAISIYLSDAERARWDTARGDTSLSEYVRAAGDHYAGVLAEGDPVEVAVEIVVRHLAERGHSLLARAIAVVTDPDPPTQDELTEIGRLARQMLRGERAD